MEKYLDLTVLTYFYNRIKTLFATKTELPTKTSDLTNDSLFVDKSKKEDNNKIERMVQFKLSQIKLLI